MKPYKLGILVMVSINKEELQAATEGRQGALLPEVLQFGQGEHQWRRPQQRGRAEQCASAGLTLAGLNTGLAPGWHCALPAAPTSWADT